MKTITIDRLNHGKKLFHFVQSILPGFKNSEIFRLIRKKTIVVNLARTEPDVILQENDQITFYIKEEYFKNPASDDKFHSVAPIPPVVYEDGDFLVINKPANLLVHPDKKNFKNTLSEQVKAYLYRAGQYNPSGYFTPSPINRIDQNTTGLVVFAKNQLALKKGTAFFRGRECEKTYLCLVYGRLEKPVLIVSLIDAGENDENKVTSGEISRITDIPAKEIFLSENPGLSATLMIPVKYSQDMTLCRVELWTGKKHQIRIHFQKAGHPLLGDQKYFTKNSKVYSQKMGLTHYYLHCAQLQFPDYPEWNAELPDDFNKILKLLEKNSF